MHLEQTEAIREVMAAGDLSGWAQPPIASVASPRPCSHATLITGLKTELRNGAIKVAEIEVTNRWGKKSGNQGRFNLPISILRNLKTDIQRLIFKK